MITARGNHRFCGRVFGRKELGLIQEVVETCAGLSRTELSYTVCELLEWKRANGRLKGTECLSFLERLEGQGFLKLPESQQTGPKKGTRRHIAPGCGAGKEPQKAPNFQGSCKPASLPGICYALWCEASVPGLREPAPTASGRVCAVFQPSLADEG